MFSALLLFRAPLSILGTWQKTKERGQLSKRFYAEVFPHIPSSDPTVSTTPVSSTQYQSRRTICPKTTIGIQKRRRPLHVPPPRRGNRRHITILFQIYNPGSIAVPQGCCKRMRRAQGGVPVAAGAFAGWKPALPCGHRLVGEAA